ncbi:MAG: hypothetical protein GX820_00155 [Bacteroidales bacterium]|jgi:hypothetical protein|nr:hypothetical protein [Bacteroidales bacterium]
MPAKFKYFNVNWENGMNINKEHFIQQENVFIESAKDSRAIFLNSMNYGLLPVDKQSGGSVNSVLKIDNQNFLRVKILYCDAVTEGGIRIKIHEDFQMPEFGINLTGELKQAENADGGDYFVLLSVDPFERQVYGDLNTDEDPPRYPYTIPTYKVSVISEKSVTGDITHPGSLFIGKFKIEQGKLSVCDDYIPPCMTVSSHASLIDFNDLTDKFFSQLEISLLSIIKKIKEKNQDTSLAKSVFALSESLLGFISANHLRLRWEIPQREPICLFTYIANAARVIRNAIDSNTSEGKEEMLNYFTNWSELKQGDFEKLLVYCISFKYKHYDILFSIEQFTGFIQIIALLFDKLESLAYIGKKKDTSIFVKEQTTKRSFLAD